MNTNNQQRAVAWWLFACCAMVFLTMVVGGVTRLTHSGLSIVEWKPLIGALPPLSHADWLEVFAKYQQTPEFIKRNHDMTLDGFQFIFWWEWAHRLSGRLIGVVFFVPYVWFLLRGRLRGALAARVFGFFILGGLQGAMGWYMVKSGLVDDPRVPLISATGSSRMGRIVGQRVAARFGKSLLELGGNNAMIISPSADLDVAIPSILFGSVGTAGQRCTSTRRVIVHRSLMDKVFVTLKAAYLQIGSTKVGNPLEASTLVGPLIDRMAFDGMQAAIDRIRPEAVEIVGGPRVREDLGAEAYYVHPCLVRLNAQSHVIHEETFAPLTYVIPYDTIEEAMRIHNDVPQGLSSAIMTTDVREAEFFKRHSDCGIANVNIGTSGAEIGGAFGGEKETGGGRESGSDSWKAYMRRQTSTTFFGREKPALAQGIKFDV